jgi:CelD/BcsL family acetyltransferase involved in cellulose biosynthesis
MEVHLRALSELDRRTEEAWADLAARAIEPNPYFDPVCVRPHARHFGLDVALLTVEQAGEMIVCLPMFSASLKWQGLPLPAWRTWNPLSTPLVAAADPEAALATALAHSASLAGPRLIVLDYLATDGPVAAALEAATAGRRAVWPSKEAHAERPALRRRADGAYLQTTLQGKHKRKVAWARRFLERQLDAPLTVVDEEGRAEAVDRLLTMEVNGWKGQIGSAVACNPRHLAYFREMCAGFAAQGRLQLLSLQAAGTTLAMKVDIRSGGTTFGLRTAYDERFAQGSPGVQLEIDAIDVFHASGDQFIDSCTNHPKNPQAWLYADRRPITRLIVTLDRAAAPARQVTSRSGR